jgi:hypothetical protein
VNMTSMHGKSHSSGFHFDASTVLLPFESCFGNSHCLLQWLVPIGRVCREAERKCAERMRTRVTETREAITMKNQAKAISIGALLIWGAWTMLPRHNGRTRSSHGYLHHGIKGIRARRGLPGMRSSSKVF